MRWPADDRAIVTDDRRHHARPAARKRAPRRRRADAGRHRRPARRRRRDRSAKACAARAPSSARADLALRGARCARARGRPRRRRRAIARRPRACCGCTTRPTCSRHAPRPTTARRPSTRCCGLRAHRHWAWTRCTRACAQLAGADGAEAGGTLHRARPPRRGARRAPRATLRRGRGAAAPATRSNWPPRSCAARHAALGEITARLDADALLGRIFASFCIGK